METNRDNAPNKIAAPEKLVGALQRSQAKRVFVPPTIDEAILRAAREQLDSPKRERRGSWFWLRWPALATACLLVCVVAYRVVRPGATYAREDVNYDGVVDVLDAFQVARGLKNGKGGVDVNGDGVIDAKDVETIAARAVRLEKGGRS
jgi:hypothetical protein